MLKIISIACLSLASLGSCSVSQSYVTNTNTINSHNKSESVEHKTESVHTVHPFTAQAATTVKPVTTECGRQQIKKLNMPEYDAQALSSAKSETEMISLLIDHIQDLKKEIDSGNKRINEFNKRQGC